MYDHGLIQPNFLKQSVMVCFEFFLLFKGLGAGEEGPRMCCSVVRLRQNLSCFKRFMGVMQNKSLICLVN